jgi:hypothetical protein
MVQGEHCKSASQAIHNVQDTKKPRKGLQRTPVGMAGNTGIHAQVLIMLRCSIANQGSDSEHSKKLC